jgi:uncharacterized protein (TIGR00369 family)
MNPSPFAHLPPMTDDEAARLRARAMAVPISSALGFTVVSLERGVCRLAMPRDPRFDGIYRSLHGGLLMTLADSAGAFALLTVVGPDEAVTTTEMNIRFLAPVHDEAIVTARVLKVGKTLCPLVAELHDGAGQLVAHAGMTYMRVRRDSSARDASRAQGGAR